jgi:hypothetical protein
VTDLIERFPMQNLDSAYLKIGSEATITDEQHPGTINQPKCIQVAAIVPNSDFNAFANQKIDRSITIQLKSSRMIEINSNNALYDPLAYATFFPQSQLGWEWKKINKVKNVPTIDQIARNEEPTNQQRAGGDFLTCAEYYKFYAHARDVTNELELCKHDFLLRGKQLSQQFWVDMWVKIETDRINYLTSQEQQKKFRKAKYSNLLEAIENDLDVTSVGSRVILPSSFQGSFRNQRQHYLDVVAIGAYYGKPDLFITLTCNPKWQALIDALRFETANARTDFAERFWEIVKNEL